jgi:hypothetical protein
MEPVSDFDFINVGGARWALLFPSEPFAPTDAWAEISQHFGELLDQVPEVACAGYIGGLMPPDVDWKQKAIELWEGARKVLRETGREELRNWLGDTHAALQRLRAELAPPPVPDPMWASEQEHWHDVLEVHLLTAHKKAWPDYYATALRAAVLRVLISVAEREGIVPPLPDPRSKEKRRLTFLQKIAVAAKVLLEDETQRRVITSRTKLAAELTERHHKKRGDGWGQRTLQNTLPKVFNVYCKGKRFPDEGEDFGRLMFEALSESSSLSKAKSK